MSVSKPGIGNYIAAHRWRVAGYVLLYTVLLACVLSTVSFSEEHAVRQYIAQRDPFQPLAMPANKHQSNPNRLAAPTTRRARFAWLPDVGGGQGVHAILRCRGACSD